MVTPLHGSSNGSEVWAWAGSTTLSTTGFDQAPAAPMTPPEIASLRNTSRRFFGLELFLLDTTLPPRMWFVGFNAPTRPLLPGHIA
jgi:hypothetical protein